MLGAVLGQTGRKPEALDANQEAVALSSQDAEPTTTWASRYKNWAD